MDDMEGMDMMTRLPRILPLGSSSSRGSISMMCGDGRLRNGTLIREGHVLQLMVKHERTDWVEYDWLHFGHCKKIFI